MPLISNLRQSIGGTVDKLGRTLRLPELGVSETIAGGSTQRTSPNYFLGDKTAVNSVKQQQVYGPPAPNEKTGQVRGAADYGYSGTNYSGLVPRPDQPVVPGVPSQVDTINQINQVDNSFFDQLEGSVGQQYDQNTGLLKNQYDQGVQTYGQQRNDRLAELQNLATQKEAEYKQAVDQVNAELGQGQNTLNQRELTNQQDYQHAQGRISQNLNDLQRRNSAYLANSGGYGSNVAQALAEQFGRQSNQAIGDVERQFTQGNQEIGNARSDLIGQATREQDKLRTGYTGFTNNLGLERTRIQNQYDQSINQLKNDYDSKATSLAQARDDRINQIAGNRAESAKSKATQTAQVWGDYANAIAQLNIDTAMNKSYADSDLNDALNQIFSAGGLTVGDTASIDPNAGTFDAASIFGGNGLQGNQEQQSAPISYRANRKPTDDDLANIFGGLPTTVSQAFA